MSHLHRKYLDAGFRIHIVRHIADQLQSQLNEHNRAFGIYPQLSIFTQQQFGLKNHEISAQQKALTL
jgi:hypothetical protein